MKIYDILIIGAGPAGLSAAIYASRAMLDYAVLEQENIPGGQMTKTLDIDNYPGFLGVDGFTLAENMRKHAEELGARFIVDKVLTLEKVEYGWMVVCRQQNYLAKTVILATGARHKKLGVDGEERLTGHGVSYCATCDGAFFRNGTVAVVGGGNTAAEDALHLARNCEKVYIIHRRDSLRANRFLVESVLKNSKIEILWNTQIMAISGEEKVSGLILSCGKTISIDGVFIAIGMSPNSEQFSGIVKMDQYGFIHGDENGVTSVPGVFVAGDIRTKKLRQIITASADGAAAVMSAEEYLMKKV